MKAVVESMVGELERFYWFNARRERWRNSRRLGVVWETNIGMQMRILFVGLLEG